MKSVKSHRERDRERARERERETVAILAQAILAQVSGNGGPAPPCPPGLEPHSDAVSQTRCPLAPRSRSHASKPWGAHHPMRSLMRKWTIAEKLPDNHSNVASAKTRFSSVDKLWKKEGLCLNELDAAVLSRWKPPGCTPQIGVDLALEQCRARARSQPHMLEPTATAGGGRRTGGGGLRSRPTAGATTPHTKAALGGCPRLF